MKRLAGKGIMVIDDDVRMLRALSKVLGAVGAAVTCASDAVDGIEVLSKRERPIDLVITDLRMPFVNGMTVVYAIHEAYPTLPVIVLTAFASAEVKAACFEQGAVAFLEKPLDGNQLIVAVRAALGLESRDPGGKSSSNPFA